ncbi:hypothetical protein [Rhodococcus rhodnii]|nr:hypothetical protein [Rhodococcus rhodnii]
MDLRDEVLTVPDECVQWCATEPHDVAVLDDTVAIDLDWWNRRLERDEIPVQLRGRDEDGRVVESGQAFVRRDELAPGPLAPTDLESLYLCAAWLYSHRDRSRARRFVDVRSWRTPDKPFDVITAAFETCRTRPSLLDGGPFREWSGWPKAPGVGRPLLSLFCWATYDAGGERPQLLDQQAVASLIRHGWIGNPVAGNFTVKQYVRYTDLLHDWARRARTTPELVEMWLTRDWRRRVAEADDRRRHHRH